MILSHLVLFRFSIGDCSFPDSKGGNYNFFVRWYVMRINNSCITGPNTVPWGTPVDICFLMWITVFFSDECLSEIFELRRWLNSRGRSLCRLYVSPLYQNLIKRLGNVQEKCRTDFVCFECFLKDLTYYVDLNLIRLILQTTMTEYIMSSIFKLHEGYRC